MNSACSLVSRGLALMLLVSAASAAESSRPIVRIARIQSAPGVEEARPTVTLGICIGSVYRITEVNLVDRGSLSKPLLIGRSFLRGRLVVDLSRHYLLEPACKRKAVP